MKKYILALSIAIMSISFCSPDPFDLKIAGTLSDQFDYCGDTRGASIELIF